MLTATTFRVLLVLTCIASIAYAALPYLGGGFLSYAEQGALQWAGADARWDPNVLTRAYIVWGLVYLVSLTGLFLFKRWGRTLFVVATLLLLGLTWVSGTSIIASHEMVVGSLATLADGAIIALTYFSELSTRFDTVPGENP